MNLLNCIVNIFLTGQATDALVESLRNVASNLSQTLLISRILGIRNGVSRFANHDNSLMNDILGAIDNVVLHLLIVRSGGDTANSIGEILQSDSSAPGSHSSVLFIALRRSSQQLSHGRTDRLGCGGHFLSCSFGRFAGKASMSKAESSSSGPQLSRAFVTAVRRSVSTCENCFELLFNCIDDDGSLTVGRADDD